MLASSWPMNAPTHTVPTASHGAPGHRAMAGGGGLGEEPLESAAGGSLTRQRLLIILPPGTIRPAQLAVAELGRVPFIAAPHGTSSRRLLDEALTDAGLSPRIAVVTAQREAILPLVLAGAGAALLPEPLAQVAARLGAVVSDPRPPITRSIVLAHRPGPLAPAGSWSSRPVPTPIRAPGMMPARQPGPSGAHARYTRRGISTPASISSTTPSAWQITRLPFRVSRSYFAAAREKWSSP